MNKSDKKRILIFFIIFVVAIAGACFTVILQDGGTGVSEGGHINKEETFKEIDVDEETLSLLKKIGGMEDKDNNGIFYILSSNSEDINGFISQLKVDLIYLYAVNNNMTISVTGRQYPVCSDKGCTGIKKEDYELISKYYNLSEFVDVKSVGEYNDSYLYVINKGPVNYTIEHDIKKPLGKGTEIKIEDVATITKTDGSKEIIDITYVFDKKDNTYYLKSRNVKENKENKVEE